MLRVRASRWIARRLGHSDRMLCTQIHLYAHPSERFIDALFYALRRERGHCGRCAAWEAAQEREPGMLDYLRAQGWL